MAGDWIPMRLDLAEDPAVIGIATSLGLDEDLVVGKLHRLWSWANEQLVDGHASSVTKMWIDRYVRCDSFASSLVDVGWLTVENDGSITIPKFDLWNSSGSKKRLKAAKRQQRARNGVVTKKSRIKRDKSVTRGEESTEENKEKKDPPNPPLMFDRFWQCYPRRVAKQTALESFNKINPTESVMIEIIAGVERWKKSLDWTKDGGQFIPYPSTFLNQRRWEEDPTPVGLGPPSSNGKAQFTKGQAEIDFASKMARDCLPPQQPPKPPAPKELPQ